jgi:hypothetical protein
MRKELCGESAQPAESKEEGFQRLCFLGTTRQAFPPRANGEHVNAVRNKPHGKARYFGAREAARCSSPQTTTAGTDLRAVLQQEPMWQAGAKSGNCILGSLRARCKKAQVAQIASSQRQPGSSGSHAALNDRDLTPTPQSWVAPQTHRVALHKSSRLGRHQTAILDSGDEGGRMAEVVRGKKKITARSKWSLARAAGVSRRSTSPSDAQD